MLLNGLNSLEFWPFFVEEDNLVFLVGLRFASSVHLMEMKYLETDVKMKMIKANRKG